MNEDEPSRGLGGLDDLRVVDPRALDGDPFARRATFLSSLRASSRGWVAAAIAVGVLGLGWQFRVPLSKGVTGGPPATSVAQTTRLHAADPVALKQQVVEELRAAGVEAIGYDRLGLSGVDARLPTPLPEAVRATLEKYAVAVPADGVIRIEITQSR
ncbi:MAG: hypothetical protein WDO68_11510 [Gammaproteobacteria bacterium]